MLESGTKVKVKSFADIKKTLNITGYCGNVWFAPPMKDYCEGEFKIKKYILENHTYVFEGISWNWLPEWFDVIKKPNDFWNDGSKEQRSLCLALYRQTLSGNHPCIHKLDASGVFTSKFCGGFNYTDFPEDGWVDKIAENIPDWKWLTVDSTILERILAILCRINANLLLLTAAPNDPSLWFDGRTILKDDSDFIVDFINKYSNKLTNSIKYENQLQRKKSDLVRGTVPEGNIICGRKRKTSVSIGHLSNKVCTGI